VKAGYVGHLRLHSKPPTLHRKPVYGNQKLKVQLSHVQTWRLVCRQTHVVQWEGRYISLSMYSNGSADTGEICNLLSILVEKGSSLIVQVTVLLMNEDFDPPKLQKSSHRPTYKESTALNFKL